MPDLTDELQRMAGEATRQAQPLPADDLLRRGERRRRRTITQWSAGGVTAAVAAVGVTLAVTGTPAASHPAPAPSRVQLAAWTVTKEANGDIDLTVHQWHDVAALQRTLRADGVPVRVQFPGQPNPCQFDNSPQAMLHVLPRVLSGRNVPAGGLKATTIIWVIHPALLPSGVGLQFGVAPIAARNLIAGFTLVKTSPACTGS
jgi:hypothetical protein